MNFLIDAQLPPSLLAVFEAAGHDSIHTLDMPDQNASRGGLLNEVSIVERRVLVTKDTVFLLFPPFAGQASEIGDRAHGQHGIVGD
jgi:predicted nuclease of predicted toxin-antitoxin system